MPRPVSDRRHLIQAPHARRHRRPAPAWRVARIARHQRLAAVAQSESACTARARPASHPGRATAVTATIDAPHIAYADSRTGARTAVGRAQAAALCGVSVDTIKRRLRDGWFPNAWRSGADQRWAIPLRDLIAAGLLASDALDSTEPAEATGVTVSSSDPGPAGDPRLGEVVAENRGLRTALARAEDEIAFLRQLLTGGRTI